MNLSKKNQKYLLVTAAIAIITVAFFVIKKSISGWRVSPNLPLPASVPISKATSNLLSFDEKKIAWKSEKQPDGQPPFFELFTPPNIYRNGKQVIMEPCTHWQFDFIFPIQLKHILRKKYRLQFEGYVQADTQDDVTVLIHDLEGNQTLHCSVGQVFKSLDFKVLSFQMRTTEKDDMIINMPVAKIRDNRDKMDLELTGDTKYYDNKYIAIVEDLEGKTYTLPDIGQEVKIGESICTLEAIDAENNVASIILTAANRQEFRKKLRILK
ncbi:MAG: hypothetical protein LBS87_01420 [Puniceicoccales bacterium]|jgi:hypothetical protein|nr:hypothetical protein [Puniceicoccales bacterium]